jgi:phosphoribosylamine--glycine ligase
VTVAETFEEAELALRSCLEDQVFGTAGACVVLEERMTGAEASLFVVTDGERWLCLPPAQDHKRLCDGDRGPNTGGMGAYSPAPICSPAVLQRTAAEIVEPTLAGLRAEGRPFVGALFVGLMIDAPGSRAWSSTTAASATRRSSRSCSACAPRSSRTSTPPRSAACARPRHRCRPSPPRPW